MHVIVLHCCHMIVELKPILIASTNLIGCVENLMILPNSFDNFA